MLKRLTLGLAAAAVVAFAAPAMAHGPNGYWHYHNYGPYAQYQTTPSVKQQKTKRNYNHYQQEQRAAEIRKECQMFAFGPWRYHPDYQHCKYY